MKTHIPFNKFKSVFTQRDFNLRYRLTKKIWIIESECGNLTIEEHPSFLGYILFILVIIAAIPVTLIVRGASGMPSIYREFVSIFIFRDALRKDDLNWGCESTIKLLSIMNLYGYGDNA